MCVKLPYCNPRIDKCLISLLQEINEKKQLKTLASCCGHGKYNKTIIVKERSTGKVFDYFTNIELGPRKRNRFYKKDNEGFYYIPELIKLDKG